MAALSTSLACDASEPANEVSSVVKSASSSHVPVYPKRKHISSFHGDDRDDCYSYLQNRKDASSVRQYIRQENKACESFLSAQHSSGLQRALFQEMRARWKEEEPSLPTLDRNYWYYMRSIRNAEHPLLCRRPHSREKNVNVNFVEEVCALLREDPQASLPSYDDEVVYLDINLLAKELKLNFVELGDLDISPDESQVAVTIDCSNGKEIFTLFIIDIHDVNYQKWIDLDAGEVQQLWAKELHGKGESIYTPLTPVTLHSSPSSSSGSFSPNTRRKGGRAFPSRPFSPQQRSTPPIAPCAPMPKHRIRRRIDMFDMSSDILWVAPTCVMYFGIDEKMRPCQVVYHDVSLDANDPEASWVCYEEADEFFWVGSLGFSSDDRFLMFSSASTEISEWYVAPVASHMWKDPVSGFVSPRVERVPMFFNDLSVPEDNLSRGILLLRQFTSRADVKVEYDLDHHSHLLGTEEAGGGAWVVTCNAQDSLNFSVFVVPDDTTTEESDTSSGQAEAGPLLAEVDSMRRLLEYDASIKVEGVEVYSKFLLITVRKAGVLTVLFCPQQLVEMWWHKHDASEPLGYDQLVDLSTVVDHHHHHEGRDQRSLHVDVCIRGDNASGEKTAMSTKKKESHTRLSEAAAAALFGVPSSSLPMALDCSPLFYAVESYPSQTSFDGLQWRISVSHLLEPNVQYACRYELLDHTTSSDHEEDASSFTVGHIVMEKLKQDTVNGPTPYNANEYGGAVVWIPSDHSFCKEEPDAHLVPTEEPSPVAEIPVTVCWKKSLFSLGTNALVLHVYGGYGDCNDPEFSTQRLSLLDRGHVWAYAAVRGGGELGIPWRDAGRKLQRATTVNDFISVSSYLQDARLCAPGRLISCGGSAGGMVVCRAMNQAPHLFFGVIGAVPFVDCLSSLLDDSLPLTITEREEYGDPVLDPLAYRLIKSLSPVDTVPVDEGLVFPHVFLQTTWGDTRVGYWEPMKLLAKLRDTWVGSAAQNRQLLFCCDFSAGHGGSSGRYEQLNEVAREYTFVLRVLEQPQ